MMDTITLKISGMTCGGCSSSVKKVLEAEDAVKSAEVDHEKGTALVNYDANKISLERFEEIIDKAGFELEN